MEQTEQTAAAVQGERSEAEVANSVEAEKTMDTQEAVERSEGMVACSESAAAVCEVVAAATALETLDHMACWTT